MNLVPASQNNRKWPKIWRNQTASGKRIPTLSVVKGLSLYLSLDLFACLDPFACFFRNSGKLAHKRFNFQGYREIKMLGIIVFWTTAKLKNFSCAKEIFCSGKFQCSARRDLLSQNKPFAHSSLKVTSGKKISLNRKDSFPHTRFFYYLIRNQVAKCLTLKNGLKVYQLAKQPPTLQTLLQNFCLNSE